MKGFLIFQVIVSVALTLAVLLWKRPTGLQIHVWVVAVSHLMFCALTMQGLWVGRIADAWLVGMVLIAYVLTDLSLVVLFVSRLRRREDELTDEIRRGTSGECPLLSSPETPDPSPRGRPDAERATAAATPAPAAGHSEDRL